VVATQGDVAMGATPGGVVVFNRETDRQGENIAVVADRVDIQAGLVSGGAVLAVAPLAPSGAATVPAGIVIGGADAGTALHLSLDEVNLIQDGFTQITFGNHQVNQSIVLQGQNNVGAAAPVVFKDPLILDIAGAGGNLSVNGQLQGDTLTVLGTLATTTTTLVDANISMGGNVTLNGLLQVDSASLITAGTASAGNILVTGNIAGVGGEAETLSLRANGGNVVVNGTVAGIDGLNVTSAVNVTFDDTVAVTGNLAIDATGVVTFNKALTLSAAGTLTIRGATSVVFENGVAVQVAGNVTIDAKSLSLLGGVDSLNSSGGVLSITSSFANKSVVLGASATDALALTATEINAIGSGFSQVVIGDGSGDIALNGNLDFSSLAASTGIDLRAEDLTMAGGTTLLTDGRDIRLSVANGHTMAIAKVDARGTTSSGVVSIDAGSGTVTDTNNDTAVDIFAKGVNFYGYGPDSAAAGNVLEVQAEVVRVAAPQGSVVRYADAEGNIHFDVINAGKSYEQLVVKGVATVTRVTEDPSTLLSKDRDALLAAGIPASSSLVSAMVPVSAKSMMSFDVRPASAPNAMAVSRYLSSVDNTGSGVTLQLLDAAPADDSLLSDASYGIAERLRQSYVLGSPGEQPLVSGLETFSQDTFEYWVDSLSL